MKKSVSSELIIVSVTDIIALLTIPLLITVVASEIADNS